MIKVYYKYINEKTIKKLMKRYIEYQGKIYSNPPEDILNKAGYYLLNTDVEKPEYDDNIQYLETKYIIEDNIIIPSYEVKTIEIDDIIINE